MNAVDSWRTRQAFLPNRSTQQFESDLEPIPVLTRKEGSSARLSFWQEQVWLHVQNAPDVPAYNESFAIRYHGELDVSALEKALSEILRRHEAWRTSFHAERGRPVQVIQPPRIINLPVIDLRVLPAGLRESEALRSAGEEARRPFNLMRGPLLRLKLIRLTDTEHWLLLTVHHIVSDTDSIYRILLPELVTLYEAFAAGNSSPLPDLIAQYPDFAEWQREQWQKGAWTDQMLFWRQQLAGDVPSLQLPADRPRPGIQTFRGDSHNVVLAEPISHALKAVGDREGANLFSTLFAIFAVLLHRYTQQSDIVIGSVVSGRNRPELEPLLGYFLNPIVLRVDFSGDPTFEAALRRVRDVISASCTNGQVPFEMLVNELQPERHSGNNPFFQVMFSLEPAMPDLPAAWNLFRPSITKGGSKFDLYAEMQETPQGVMGRFTYNSDVFDESTIARMIEHFVVLAEGIAANPGLRISDLPVLSASEQEQLLVTWNQTAQAYPRNLCIHQLFEAQAERTPDALAATFNGQSLTYQELNRRANQLAAHLRQLGVGPETIVGLATERGLEMFVAVLGILKSGGAYLPLDPAYPEERLAFMLQDAKAPVLVTQESLGQSLPSKNTRVVRLDADWEALQAQSPENPTTISTPENLAYVIYTSGSTGKPKGVQIPHRAVVNFLTSMANSPGMTSNDRLLAVTTLSFDIAGLELLLPLTVGASVEIAARDITSDGLRLAQKLADSGANIMQATPATWRLLLEAGWQGNPRLKILCGGEALSRELANELMRRSGSLWNMYGPTETTIWSLVQEVRSEQGRILLGRPIANTQLYLLDTQLKLVPVGVLGELYIGGDGLARGYLDRPELTAEKFIRHPYSNDPGARLYRTGDLARYLPSGEVEFLGRADHQVKIRGFRIELGEIEAALSQIEAVKQSAVVACDDATGSKNIVAYVVLSTDEPPKPEEIRDILKKKLPAYMIPSRFVVLDRLPLMPNGKLDRNGLLLKQSRPEINYAKPRSPLEEQILQIWEELLEVHPIGVQDDFFELGGNSLLAVRLMYRIAQSFGRKLPLATLLAGPTVEYLTSALLNAGPETFRAPLTEVQAGGA